MESVIFMCILAAIIIYQFVIQQLDKKNTAKKEKELLNRIMARDFAQFVQGEEILTRPPTEVDADYEEGYPVN